MRYISHRGFRVGVVENTFQAFQRSIDLKMDYIELDVQLSRDGLLFVLHDNNLERIFQNSNSISNLSAKELKSLRSEEFDQGIPELKEVIEYLLSNENTSTKLIIELKGSGTATPTCKMIEEYKIKDRVVFSGRNLNELKIAHKLLPQVPLCLNITKCKDFTLSKFLETTSMNELPLPFTMKLPSLILPGITPIIPSSACVAPFLCIHRSSLSSAWLCVLFINVDSSYKSRSISLVSSV